VLKYLASAAYSLVRKGANRAQCEKKQPSPPGETVFRQVRTQPLLQMQTLPWASFGMILQPLTGHQWGEKKGATFFRLTLQAILRSSSCFLFRFLFRGLALSSVLCQTLPHPPAVTHIDSSIFSFRARFSSLYFLIRSEVTHSSQLKIGVSMRDQ
jgi:hypothetical protein